MGAIKRARRRDYLGFFLRAMTWAAAVVSAGAYGGQHHDTRRAVAGAAAVVALGGLAALTARAARRARMPALAVAQRALSAARQNTRRIEACESRERRVIQAIEADAADRCGADAPTDPRGLHLVRLSVTARDKAAG